MLVFNFCNSSKLNFLWFHASRNFFYSAQLDTQENKSLTVDALEWNANFCQKNIFFFVHKDFLYYNNDENTLFFFLTAVENIFLKTRLKSQRATSRMSVWKAEEKKVEGNRERERNWKVSELLFLTYERQCMPDTFRAAVNFLWKFMTHVSLCSS